MADSSTLSKKIQNLRSFTVQIRHVKTGAIVGTGFVVSADGLIVTCAHVVVAAGVNPRLGRSIPSYWELIRNKFFEPDEALQDTLTPIPIYFQWARIPEQRPHFAVLQHCFYNSDDDVVLLKLEAALPEGIVPADVATAEESVGYEDSHSFVSLGYRRQDSYRGMPAEGKIINFSGAPTERTVQADLLMLQSQHIDSGMSGAAVLDKKRNKVVGIVAETFEIHQGSDRDTSFAIDYAVVNLFNDVLSSIPSPKGEINSPVSISPSSPTVKPIVKPVALSSDPPPKKRIDLSRAPALVEEWAGREAFLSALDRDWVNSQCHLTGVIGFGGEGKSTLARQWVHNLEQDAELPQPDGVFWWGFYEQPSIDEFFDAVLNYLDLGNIDPGQLTSVEAKAQTIRAMRGRYLFVLDGLEVLQEQEGDDYGLLKNRDLCTFLRIFADGNHASFCLLTSRFPVLDLIDYTSYQHRELGPLELSAGCQLLRNIRIQGSNKELEAVVRDWGGYALSLRWLGTYLLDQHQGKVKRVRKIPIPDKHEPVYDRLQKLLRDYDGYLTQAEKEFLKVFSLFRLPVVEGIALQQVFQEQPAGFYIPPRKKPIDPITKFLQKLKKSLDWILQRKRNSLVALREKLHVSVAELNSYDFLNALLHRLISYRIVKNYPESKFFTLHPLIRNHYLAQVTQEGSERVKVIHRRIGRFYKNTLIQENPTLTDLTPLIEAVHHLCQAGDYDEAFEFAWQQIFQRERRVLTTELGAWDTSLEMMKAFFPNNDWTQNPLVISQGEQAWILNHVGLCLMMLGRLKEASQFYERSNQIRIRQEDWRNASIGYQNLTTLYAALGDLIVSSTAAKSALTYAHRADCPTEECDSLFIQGWIDHLQGNLHVAQTVFQKSNSLGKQVFPNGPHPYGFRGMRYAEYLRCTGDTDYARSITEANQIIAQQNRWIHILSLCHRLLGDLDAAEDNVHDAQTHYNEALHLARRISGRDVLIEALLARGRWAAQQGNVLAAGDLEEALGYAVAGGYRIYEADIRVALAWMNRAAGNLDVAQKEAIRAQHMSQEMGYHWGQVDAAEVLAVLENRES